MIAAEPALAPVLSGEQLDAALLAIADFVDLKSPYTLGHASAVADLVRGGRARAGSARRRRTDARSRRASCTISGGWASPTRSGTSAGRSAPGEWERVRLHPYLTERMLQQSAALAPLGRLAVQHRERLDGSGYPRRLSGAAIDPARCSSAPPTLTRRCANRARTAPRASPRTRRASCAPKSRRVGWRPTSVDAVLAVAGHRVPRRRAGPAGLTQREIEVLRLLARGLSNKEIAQRLVISPKTVGNHVEHIYTKIGATNRAGASLFAIQRGLLPEEEPVAS